MVVEVIRHQRLGLCDEGRHPFAVVPVQHGPSEVGERERGAGPVAEILVEGDGLFEGGYCSFVVVLEGEDKAEAIERPGPDGGEASGVPLERRLEPHFAFLETAPAPEPPHRGRETQPQPRALCLFTGLQGPRMCLPKARELGQQPPHPPSLIGSQQLGFGPLGEGQVVLGVPAAGLLGLPALL